jgi:hypothetical protein
VLVGERIDRSLPEPVGAVDPSRVAPRFRRRPVTVHVDGVDVVEVVNSPDGLDPGLNALASDRRPDLPVDAVPDGTVDDPGSTRVRETRRRRRSRWASIRGGSGRPVACASRVAVTTAL